MSLKVREILELAETKGCSLAAGKGGLDRVVRFVDCMEIPDIPIAIQRKKLSS